MPDIESEKNAICQKLSKTREMASSDMSVFSTFLAWYKRSQFSFFTRHRSQQGASFDIKLSMITNGGNKLTWATLDLPYIVTINLTSKNHTNSFKFRKTDFRFVFSAQNWVG